jgi:hypothetical protein
MPQKGRNKILVDESLIASQLSMKVNGCQPERVSGIRFFIYPFCFLSIPMSMGQQTLRAYRGIWPKIICFNTLPI